MTTQERKNFQARFDEALVALQTARGAALLLASAERCRGVQEEYERRASELDQIRAMLAETADDSAAEETRLLKSGETAAAVSALLSHNRERVLEIRLLRASEEAQITELRASVKALKLGHSDSIDALQKELELTKRQQRAVEIRCSALAVQNDERAKTLLAIRDVLRAGGAAGNLESDAGLIGAVREAVSSVGSKLAEYNRGVSEGTQALLGMLNGALEDGGSSVDALSRVRKLVAKAREQHEEILALQREVQGDRDQTRALRHQLSELGCSVSLSLLQAVEGLGERLRAAERDLTTVTAERDEAMAEKLRWSGIADSANRELELAWLELGPDDDHATVAGGIRDLRARLAKTEAVVEAARKLPVDYRARDWVEEALRALDSPVGAGTDSGGSGAAPVSASADVATPEPAGTIPYVIGPPLRFDSRGAFDDDDSPVGVAATAEDGHEAPARNRQPVEPPSDPATGTTRREPPETDRQDGSTGAVAETEQVDEWTHRLRVPGGWLYRWETPAYNGSPGGAAMAFVPEPDEAVGK